MAEGDLRTFAVNDLRGGEDLQLEELPLGRLEKAGAPAVPAETARQVRAKLPR